VYFVYIVKYLPVLFNVSQTLKPCCISTSSISYQLIQLYTYQHLHNFIFICRKWSVPVIDFWRNKSDSNEQNSIRHKRTPVLQENIMATQVFKCELGRANNDLYVYCRNFEKIHRRFKENQLHTTQLHYWVSLLARLAGLFFFLIN
jgi:hypothetical protein